MVASFLFTVAKSTNTASDEQEPGSKMSVIASAMSALVIVVACGIALCIYKRLKYAFVHCL